MTKIRNRKYLQAFGAHIRRLREAKNLSQEELYDLAGISKNQIGNIERGEVNTTISSVYAISKALDIPAPNLFMFEFTAED
ncbi:helix-turn-helix domain-containing protein [Dyadobacter sp. 3J3]|uniref:helix-turn-helix domain-containing protein n=1 Tax=Dyadobacter sp. 3J3 TaxID=2606600 RepID=UPI00190F40C9|nr:helix-turn-helix transcriptional regulator [Dyadobacter sp. 3J3]